MQEETRRYIVTENPLEIRYLAARHIAQKPYKYVFGIIMFYALYEWAPNFLGIAFPKSVSEIYEGSMKIDLPSNFPTVSFSSAMYMLLLGGALLMGRSLYMLTFLRNNSIEYDTLLEGMQFYLKATFINFLRLFITGAMTALFIIPGLIFYYAYSQSMYVYADDPSKGVIDCLRESRLMMAGNKLALFRLDFSYLLLIISGLLPAALAAYTGNVNTGSYFGVALMCVLSTVYAAAISFALMGRVVFYELMKEGGFANFRYAGEALYRHAANMRAGSRGDDAR